MLWSDRLGAHVHLLPVTKIQFEYFLTDRPEPHFSESWYKGVLAHNPRVSPGKVRQKNYWNAFLTGLTPEEAGNFANWLGKTTDDAFELPTSDEWYELYQEMKGQPPLSQALFRSLNFPARVEALLQNVDKAAAMEQEAQRDLADSMMLREGVFEWVQLKGDKWGGAGLPNGSIGGGIINLDAGQPKQPQAVDPAPPFYGFRLLKR